MSRLPTGQRLASPPVHRRSSIEPIGRAAGTIGKVLPLRDDTFEAKLAGVGEDGRAVALDVLVEPDAGLGLGHDGCAEGR